MENFPPRDSKTILGIQNSYEVKVCCELGHLANLLGTRASSLQLPLPAANYAVFDLLIAKLYLLDHRVPCCGSSRPSLSVTL